MAKKAMQRQMVTLDDLPLEVRAAVMNAQGQPISIKVPSRLWRFSPEWFAAERKKAGAR